MVHRFAAPDSLDDCPMGAERALQMARHFIATGQDDEGNWSFAEFAGQHVGLACEKLYGSAHAPQGA